jgi:hypothetical protein
VTLPEVGICIIAVAEGARLVIELTRFILERIAEREAAKWRGLGAFAAGAVGDLVAKYLAPSPPPKKPDDVPAYRQTAPPAKP